ncbi:hypothetical protein [Qaidamihabitans albus]|uniref:hypothetical protein n=1 Tax=Qaidamihabitans albus TaxID=2795733 RepID=UPI0018F223D3|nr:hypothetical protein [Qaidamihabitans albus]
MTTAITPLGNVAKLALVARRHVTTTPAPEPCTVTLYPHDQTISLQPRVRYEPVAVLGALLIWTHRLTGIIGRWWHTPGGVLHITLTGRGPYGTRIKVYSGFPYEQASTHLRLEQGRRESVTPDELYRLALTLRTRERDTP